MNEMNVDPPGLEPPKRIESLSAEPVIRESQEMQPKTKFSAPGMDSLRDKLGEEVYKAFTESVAQQMCTKSRKHQEKMKKMSREARYS